MKDKEIEAIVNPIFTKMFDSNFSACEYGIECYKKGMEYQGIKELATENDNLIKQVKNLESKIEEYKKQIGRKEKALAKTKKGKDKIYHRLVKDNKRLIRRKKELEAQVEKMKADVELARDNANETENWETFSVLNLILADWEIK